jgi:protein SMG7
LLQRIYQQVLILDLEYALDRKVEQELWNHGFKNYIGTLQNLAKDKKVCLNIN